MKAGRFVIAATVVLASLTFPFCALSETSELTLQTQTAGEITYISGGVGQDEVSELKQVAPNYLLEIVFVQKADLGEGYLAGVKLQIKDAKNNIVLDIATDGPIFLADFPPGAYLITAEYNGVVKTDRVRIAAKKHQRTVFLWPM